MRGILFLSCFFCVSAYSQNNWKDIIERSEAFYETNTSGVVEINKTMKNVLKTDTNFSTLKFLFYKDKKKVAKLTNSSSPHFYTIIKDDKGYNINEGKSRYYITKETKELLSFLPQWSPAAFYKEYYRFGRWFKPIVEETDDEFIIKFNNRSNRNSFLYINKKNYELNKCINIITSRRGSQFKQYEFYFTNSSSSPDTILSNLSYATSNYRQLTDRSLEDSEDEYEEDKKNIINSKIDSLNLLTFLRGAYEANSPSRYILLDFFHQACMPCVKAIPELNNLNDRFSSTLMIVGVDIIKDDIGHKDSFIKKYKVSYPIVDGEQAVNVKSLIPELRIMYPTMVLIAPDGTVIDIMDGYTKKHYRWLNTYFEKLM